METLLVTPVMKGGCKHISSSRQEHRRARMWTCRIELKRISIGCRQVPWHPSFLLINIRLSVFTLSNGGGEMLGGLLLMLSLISMSMQTSDRGTTDL